MSKALCTLANRVRISALVAIHSAGSGHPGGTLSACDLITYFGVSEIHFSDSEFQVLNNGNRFILSKGHACPALYALIAECGVIPLENLRGFRKLGNQLQGHPDVNKFPWVFASTGSLGQGYSIALGIALGLRHINRQQRVYVLVGDGELQEGEIWEGAMCAAQHNLDNFCVIIDRNNIQSDNFTSKIIALEPLREKWEAFNWYVLEINGHDFSAIDNAVSTAKNIHGKPTVIIANTVKGKGVSYMENNPEWHGSVKLRDEQLARALEELGVTKRLISSYFDSGSWYD